MAFTVAAFTRERMDNARAARVSTATEGKEVQLPQGSVLRVRIDSPVAIQGTATAR